MTTVWARQRVNNPKIPANRNGFGRRGKAGHDK